MLHVRSAESQIAVTTFTVGLGAIWLGFHWFARRVNPCFGCVAMLVLMTDYVMFMQWQVNTYRVWHGFALFACLTCVEYAAEGRRTWAVLTMLTFFCLYYYEFVFVFFVTVTVCTYSMFLYFRQKLVFLRLASFAALGGLLGAALLIAQLIAYMGIDATLQDISYTVRSRQFAAQDADADQKLFQFYKAHNIIFWANFVDGSVLRTPKMFLGTTLLAHLACYSPLVWMPAAMIVGGFTIGRGFDWLSRRMTFLRHSNDKPITTIHARLAFVPMTSAFAICFLRFLSHLDRLGDSSPGYPDSQVLGSTFVALFSILLWVAAVRWSDKTGILGCWIRSFLAAGLMSAVHLVGNWMLDHQKGITLALSDHPVAPFVLLAGHAGATVLGCLLLLGGRCALPRSSTSNFSSLLPYMAAGGIGYVAVCFLFGGYVLSGYLERWLSFFVFSRAFFSLSRVIWPSNVCILSGGFGESSDRISVASICLVLALASLLGGPLSWP